MKVCQADFLHKCLLHYPLPPSLTEFMHTDRPLDIGGTDNWSKNRCIK